MYMEEKSGSPLVSVIMPAYNAEPYIEEAIRSVLNQTVRDLELIVIDDTSTDRTRDIIRAIAHEDRRVRPYFNEKNLGVAKTRNRGLELCHGRYVALLDSDDYWKPQINPS
ncbi:MAG: glycosyltransferase family 2 protein [Ruminococcus sp.]|nr:glycosyltransferase family 2 protein [Ruminococcus sp.]